MFLACAAILRHYANGSSRRHPPPSLSGACDLGHGEGDHMRADGKGELDAVVAQTIHPDDASLLP